MSNPAALAEGEKILVVDDDARLRRLLERFLDEQGYRVRAVENTEQMDRLLSRELFQLVVLDLMLPGEDGLTACRRLREQNNQVPIIMLTAKGDEGSRILGCPSDRVQHNMIGACLMGHPALVADCVKAMLDAVEIAVTVKHRIGINGRDSYAELCDFVGQVREAGCRSFTVHARIAILEGLSPKENREVPPLRYEVAAQLKKDFPDLEIVLNGGIKTLEACREHLQTFDGVMLGREAYHNPYLLAAVDSQLFGSEAPPLSRSEALLRLRPYIERHQAEGGAMHHVTRHILGLAQGFPGSRRFRQLLSVDVHKAADPLRVFDQALELLAGR